MNMSVQKKPFLVNFGEFRKDKIKPRNLAICASYSNTRLSKMEMRKNDEKKLQQISYDVADASSMVASIWNYLECVDFSLSKAENTTDVAMVFHGLKNNQGLSNIMSNLKIVNEKLDQCSGEILDHCKKSEGEADA